MPVITIETYIQSDIDTCFDLSRSIDLHEISTAHTNEKAVAGITQGLINLNETVTWQATHFGIRQYLTSKITQFNKPYHFRDEQVKGAFKCFTHDHFFEETPNGIKVTDRFYFESPLGILGRIANRLFLTRYMFSLLAKRNAIIKEFAETDRWKTVLKQE